MQTEAACAAFASAMHFFGRRIIYNKGAAMAAALRDAGPGVIKNACVTRRRPRLQI